MLAKIKIGLFVLVALASLIIIFQNLTEVEVRLLFVEIKMPKAILLLATLLVGFVLGLAANTLLKMRAWRAKSKTTRPTKSAPPSDTTDK